MRLLTGGTPIALVLVFMTPACGGKTLALGPSADAGATSGSTVSSGTGTTGSGSTPCGNPGEPCCLGVACNGGACCVDRTCVAQGAPCGHSLGACTEGSCGACGSVGQQCCDGVQTPSCSSGPVCAGCTAANAMCPGAQGGATCVACGGDGQPCCSGLTCAGKYSLCRPSIDTDGTCTSRCGQVGQDCCSNDFADESSLACRNGAVCLWQTTVRQTTATGSICIDPSTCGYSNGKCTTCGVAGTPCCGGSACVPGEGVTCFFGTGKCQKDIPKGGP
ncbi:MAG TPA: hypothetical protein VGY54_09260 [Polyangiaceae bacterium]|nr:hypothetical protein [Polyangiaceae bacterium]